jgi:conjugal transfer/entry exclusion protein
LVCAEACCFSACNNSYHYLIGVRVLENYIQKINSLKKEIAIAEKQIKELLEEADYQKMIEAYEKLELSAKRKVKRLLKKYNYLIAEDDDNSIYVCHKDINENEDIFFDNHYADDWQDALCHCEEYIEWHKNNRT